MKVVAYCRYSSDNQREESIDAQLRAINDFCVKESHQLIQTYIDVAISGTSTENRTNFNLMVEDSKKKLFGAVIVHKLDRFARNRYDSAIAKKKLENNSVRVVSVTERLDDSPESVILESVLEGMSEYYSKNLSREVKKGLKENALKCQHTCGRPPLGYDVDSNRKFQINEPEAIIVRKIFELFILGYGYRGIAEYLNNDGLKNKQGREFRKTSLRDTLLNEKYMGTYFHGKKDGHGKLKDDVIIIKNGIPSIVSENTFNLVQAKMALQNATFSRKQTFTNYLLTGLASCSMCGGKYSGGYRSQNRDKSLVHGYLCINRKNKVNKCTCKPLRKELLEDAVLQILSENIFTPTAIEEISLKVFNYIKERSSSSEETNIILEKEENKLRRNLETLLELYLEEKVDKEIYNKKRLVTENKIHEITIKKYNYVSHDAFSDIDKIRSFIKKMSLDLKSKDINLIKNVFNTFINKIEIDNDSIRVAINLYFMDMDEGGGSGGNRTRVQNC